MGATADGTKELIAVADGYRESEHATVRLRTKRTTGSGSRTACLTMVFKLARCAERTWRKLNGSVLLPEVIRGVKFVDGERQDAAEDAA